MAVELKWTKCGQYHAYGDSHYVCEIHTDEELTKEQILKLVKNHRLPYAEWSKNFGDPNVYFSGYYQISKQSYGYRYEGVDPYTD